MSEAGQGAGQQTAGDHDHRPGDIAMAVEAMKAGAVDFIEKPIGDGELLTTPSSERCDHVPSSPEHSEWRAASAVRIAGLTKRRAGDSGLIVAGHANKEIAARLGVAQRTVESHRAIVMKKMGAKSLAKLVRLSLAATSPGSDLTFSLVALRLDYSRDCTGLYGCTPQDRTSRGPRLLRQYAIILQAIS